MNYQALKRSEHIQLLQQKDLKIHYLQFELEQLKRAIFGSKSERFVPEVSPDQLLLFEELFIQNIHETAKKETERVLGGI